MTLVPIVERELRLAVRKRSTIWFRLLVALAALVIGSGFLTMNMAVGANSSRLGGGLFATVSWMALVATLFSGVFFTADSLSEEKREGTLGFLFLTDLRGYDVVGGKLLATSLRGSYALLALFPVLAVTLLMGGVTGLQLFRSTLALTNALFCSLAAGLFVSSLCRDSQRAMAGTFMLIILFCAGGPIADSIVRIFVGSGWGSLLSLVSPAFVFWAASAWGRVPFWTSLLTSHLAGWGCLALACVLVRRSWQDRPRRFSVSTSLTSYSRYGSASARTERRRKFLEPNPVVWLALRERWQALAVWIMVLLVLIPFGAVVATVPSMAWVMWAQISWLFVMVLYLWISSQAARFFIEARKSGLTELLLVSPLDSKSIVLGHWIALLRTFGLPIILFLLVQLCGTFFSQHTTMRMVLATGGAAPPSLILSFILGISGALGVLANLIALVWFGMWMGLTCRNIGVASVKAIVLVQVLPWMAISFVSTSLIGLLMFRGLMKTGGGSVSNSVVFTFPVLISMFSVLLTLAKDFAFILWSRQRLLSNFRTVAARPVASAVGLAPLFQRPPPLPSPPVISGR